MMSWNTKVMLWYDILMIWLNYLLTPSALLGALFLITLTSWTAPDLHWLSLVWFYLSSVLFSHLYRYVALFDIYLFVALFCNFMLFHISCITQFGLWAAMLITLINHIKSYQIIRPSKQNNMFHIPALLLFWRIFLFIL